MWTWAAASVRGTSHERTGTPRQDAFRCVAAQDGAMLVAIACDGAGSASHGRQGAAIAARHLSHAALAHARASAGLPGDKLVADWVDEARDRIAAAASRRALSPRDFATTVVMVATTGEQTMAIQIGDGAAVGRLRADGSWTALSWPEHGEFASTTFFLTDEAGVRLRISRSTAELDRLAVLTDGIERLALDFARGVPHAPFFEGVSRPVAESVAEGVDCDLSRKLGAYLASDAVNQRTDDDKTLILAALR